MNAVNPHKFHQCIFFPLAFSYKENVVCNLALSALSMQLISTEGRSIDSKDVSKLLNSNDLALQNETSGSIAKVF